MTSLETLAWLSAELERGKLSAARLRRLLFGSQSEKQSDLFPGSRRSEENRQATSAGSAPKPAGDKGESSTGESADGTGEEKYQRESGEKPRGHGRSGAVRYMGAKRCRIPHQTLIRGQVCPECGIGTLYPFGELSAFVRVMRVSPLKATVYELSRLRCSGCGQVFTASLPERVGQQKYDETVMAMIGLLRYGTGLPFNRLS